MGGITVLCDCSPFIHRLPRCGDCQAALAHRPACMCRELVRCSLKPFCKHFASIGRQVQPLSTTLHFLWEPPGAEDGIFGDIMQLWKSVGLDPFGNSWLRTIEHGALSAHTRMIYLRLHSITCRSKADVSTSGKTCRPSTCVSQIAEACTDIGPHPTRPIRLLWP
jgi:hypothetical protein